MKTVAAIALSAALGAATIATSAAPAQASHRDAAIALGIAGLVIGGVAASRYRGHYGYYGPNYGPYYGAGYYNPGPYHYRGGYSGRVSWCIANYRSYNPHTRMYRGYDGRLHYC